MVKCCSIQPGGKRKDRGRGLIPRTYGGATRASRGDGAEAFARQQAGCTPEKPYRCICYHSQASGGRPTTLSDVVPSWAARRSIHTPSRHAGVKGTFVFPDAEHTAVVGVPLASSRGTCSTGTSTTRFNSARRQPARGRFMPMCLMPATTWVRSRHAGTRDHLRDQGVHQAGKRHVLRARRVPRPRCNQPFWRRCVVRQCEALP